MNLRRWMGLFLLCFLLASARTGWAHKIALFAWEQDGRIHAEGRFYGGGMVREGQVRVLAPDGTLLLEGRTDEQGAFVFSPPRPGNLKLVLLSGDGHRSEFDFEAGPALPETPSPQPAPQEDASVPSPDVLRVEIEAALEKKLTPVLKALAEERERVRFQQVLAGLGYIAGLVGVGCWLASRRRKPQP